MADHELKIQPKYFSDVRQGLKTFELRKNDRNFKPYQVIKLREWSKTYGYSKREIMVEVTYILDAPSFGVGLLDKATLGLMPGYCILGIRKL